MKRKIKKPVLYSMYALSIIALTVTATYINHTARKFQLKKPDIQYVTRLFGSEDIPVVNTEQTIMRPYTDSEVKIVENYYDYQATEEEQEKSITNYEQTYIQNNGVAYGKGEESFDVTASLPGTVTSITDDKLLGKIVTIKYNEKVTLIYQGLSEVNVQANCNVNQNDVIGKSGNTNMNKDLGSHIIFQIKIDNKYVNPENYYDKNVSEL